MISVALSKVLLVLIFGSQDENHHLALQGACSVVFKRLF